MIAPHTSTQTILRPHQYRVRRTATPTGYGASALFALCRLSRPRGARGMANASRSVRKTVHPAPKRQTSNVVTPPRIKCLHVCVLAHAVPSCHPNEGEDYDSAPVTTLLPLPEEHLDGEPQTLLRAMPTALSASRRFDMHHVLVVTLWVGLLDHHVHAVTHHPT